MPAQIMRPQVNSNHLSGFLDNQPGRCIGNRENAVIWSITCLNGVVAESISHLLRDEHDLMFFTAFGFSKDQLPILNVLRSQLQHLADPHPPTGHQLKNQSIADFSGTENDLINGFFFDDFPSGYHPFSIQFSDHGRVTRIAYARINVIAEKIEKGRQVGIANSLGVGLVAIGKAVQKRKDVIRC